jgi:lycopene cyclase domain-containing protein
MTYLYFLLDIGSFFIPFLFSFHPKLQFYKKWKSLFPAIFIMMAFFIPWDIIFTNQEIWGFNKAYITGYEFFNLPVEEWLFFICIPYACLFTHYALHYFFPKLKLSDRATSVIYVFLISILLGLLLYNYDRLYTVVNFTYAILILGLVFNYRRSLLNTFFPAFLVILIPFFLINGILTGSIIENPVVWYDHSENLNTRILTIPVEDSIYALGMLLTVLVCTEYFEERNKAKIS